MAELMLRPTREDLGPDQEDLTISLVVAVGTCADHALHAMCERLVDESHPDGGCMEPLESEGYDMACDLLAEAESWLNDHHVCGETCSTCPECHPELVS